MITTKDISGISKGHVLDADGHKIGSVGQIFVDNTTGEPAWATVHTGLFGNKHSFVPLSEATVSGEDVRVPFGKAKIKDAPRVEADGELSPAEEEELYRYYGLHGDERGRDERRDERPVDTDLNSHGMVEAQAAAAGGHTGGNEVDQPHQGTRTEQAGPTRIRRYVVTEQQTITVPVTHEEFVVETDPTARDARTGEVDETTGRHGQR